jgi:membrane associated rhomboid family serine protease
MLALASIGPLIELTIGPKRFLRFYLFCGVLGGILVAFLDPSVTPVVGASGAIFGVLVAFAIYFPHQKLMFFFLPPIESRWIVIGLGLISAVLVVIQALSIDIGSVGMLSHFGHLAGMLSAVLYFYLERFMPILKK